MEEGATEPASGRRSTEQLARVYNAGLNLLARREHSSKELEQNWESAFRQRLSNKRSVI